MDGLQAARAIREGGIDGAWVLDPEIWMIALTANATGNDRELSLAAGMNDFLPKPVDERALAQALHRAVDALRARGRTLRPAVQSATDVDSSLAALDALLLDEPGNGDAIAGVVVAERPVAAPVAAPIRSLAERLAEAFRAETPRLLTELAEALSVHDFARAARIAHNIKGSAYYIQCEEMAENAGALEQACDDGDAPAVQTHWDNLQHSIESWISQN